MSVLTRKLWRDAWHTRGQMAAIAAVVASGIALFVTLRSMQGYLRAARDQFYSEYRFAEVFAPLKRAPVGVVRAVEEIPGVQTVQSRIVFEVTLEVPGLREPAIGRLVSIPVPHEPMLNELHLLSGRWPLPGATDEVIASAAFARANDLTTGDSVGAVLHGRWQRLRIVGTAMSPEYVYEIGAASVFPDNQRFGVLWMGRDILATAFDLEGAFNDLVLTLGPQASTPDVLASLDRLLERYGGVGAYTRDEQLSNQFVKGEIDQAQITSILLPAIFLGVTAFLLHIVMSRLIGTQREEIATLRAFGMPRRTIAAHFLQLALVPVVAGSVLGTILGLWFADMLAVLYAQFFQFPSADFVADWRIVAAAIAVGGGAGVLGALQAVQRSAQLPPAEGLRPAAPSGFRGGLFERMGLGRHAGPVTRLIARSIERRPARALFSIVGLALAGGLMITVQSMFDAINLMKVRQFQDVMGEDIVVTFETPRPAAAVGDIARLPGVVLAEGFRAVPVRLTHRAREYRTAILALEHDAELHRIVDMSGARRPLPATGLLLSDILARILGVERGDRIRVQVLEGEQPVGEIELAGTTSELVGSSAYMTGETLRQLIGGAPAVTGAHLAIDPRLTDSLYDVLKRLPAVSAVSVREVQLRGFEQTIAESFSISLVTMLAFAVVIAFGIVYNASRVALSERGRELASLRVLGFTRAEVSAMLLGEQAILLLLSVPVSFAVAYGLSWLISVGFQSELYRIPIVVNPVTYLVGALTVVVAGVLSALAVGRRIRRLDLVAVLKTRE